MLEKGGDAGLGGNTLRLEQRAVEALAGRQPFKDGASLILPPLADEEAGRFR
ncbi:hypothetical protein [Sphingobium sp. WCS2017Hpa-17]|uniref:hypothetical protein n=1 Tax=Sphingobium sp. WCS2017Hpa-17 TaxID=3073638 RepID=UPI00288990BE|nr:hypothetical protein [Sphingobium sp. WCS2017Hpa-17]